ncbi:MAG: ATP-grasp domain-containing protein [Pseudomonadales bacterium]|nr:ATP-grasp domain-containing protein [Pseudomonadales bacterium]
MTRRYKCDVLVLDGDTVPALSVARSLSRLGVSVDIASHVPQSIAGYSRFVARKHIYPNPLESETSFLSWCDDVIKTHKYRLVIPVTERTMVPMQALLGDPDIAPLLAIPPVEALCVALDKAKTVRLATQLGLPVPKSHHIESREQLSEIIDSLDFPVVIKPSRSIGGGKNARSQLMVEYAFTASELVAQVKHGLNFGSVLIQQYISGQGVGIELIADHGDIKFAFQHLRLHEVPLTGGGSSLRVSIPIDEPLLDASRALIKALKWHGVAMVEFKWNPHDQTFSIMEINGRFWGSLPLAVAAGADFPAMLFELLVDGHVKPRAPARAGVYGRVLSRDIQWYEHILRRDAPKRLFQYPSKYSLVTDLLRIFSFKHSFDVQDIRDPLPGLVDIRRIISGYISRFGNLVAERRNQRARIRDWGRAYRQLKNERPRQICFLCYGNINRSALAEQYIRLLMPDTDVKIVSAGFHQEQNRPADPVMIEIAGEMGVDMQYWSSKLVTENMLSESDIIFVMEHSHFKKIQDQFPGATHKTFLLGKNEKNSTLGLEISDPYGKAREIYEQCVREVTSSIREIVNLMPPKK